MKVLAVAGGGLLALIVLAAAMLGLRDGRRIGDWVDPQPVNGEHAIGFMQFLPTTLRAESAAAPGNPRDPYQPADAMVTAGSYPHRLETGAPGGVPHDLRGALAVYGGSLGYADEVLSLAEPPAPVAGLPVAFPIPVPGWVQRIATPQWPADLAAHMSPSAITNQCVAGALATWALMHPADPRWNHRPPLFGNAIDLRSVAWPHPAVLGLSWRRRWDDGGLLAGRVQAIRLTVDRARARNEPMTASNAARTKKTISRSVQGRSSGTSRPSGKPSTDM